MQAYGEVALKSRSSFQSQTYFSAAVIYSSFSCSVFQGKVAGLRNILLLIGAPRWLSQSSTQLLVLAQVMVSRL